MSLLPAHTTLAILASHKLGHAMQCEGVARALSLSAEIRPVRPRKPFHWLAPWGPVDPRDRNGGDAPLREPFPDIAIASSRETVPYLRAMKRLSAGRTFCVYLGDPRVSHTHFDLIALPEHDAYRAANVLATLTPPHPRDEAARKTARDNPDPRIAALAAPRIALLLGGPSGNYKYLAADIDAIRTIAAQALASGASLMVSPSRRTPAALVEGIRQLGKTADASRVFVWDGAGANPYLSILALADAFVVTADSVNMIAEAVATGKPVHSYEPSGHAGKVEHLLGELQRRGIIRPWTGKFETWIYEPVDSTQEIAREIARRFAQFRQRLQPE